MTPCTATAGPTRALGLYKPGEPVALEDGFRAPPPISRVQCWWQCHGSAFSKAEISRQLEAFKAAGMGGVTIKDTLAMPRDEHTAHIQDIPFMSPAWLEMFAHCVNECMRLGLICRCRLGSGWNAGGPWVTPELSSQVLGFAQSPPIAGPSRYEGEIPTSEQGQPGLEAIERGDAFVLAVPEAGAAALDLTDRVSQDRTLAWQAPEGVWRIVSCFSTPSGIRLLSASPSGEGLHHDHMSAAGTDLQLRKVAEPIRATLGPFEETAFDGFNVDSWEMGKPTWTPGFRQEFMARRGYDPVPYLPALRHVEDDQFLAAKVAADVGEQEARFLFDLRTTVSDLIAETHYARVSAWCRAHGVAFEAEAGGGPGHGLPKDLLQCQGAVDVPMGEFWMHGRSYVKLASSAAHAYGKRLVALESFTETRKHFALSPARMKIRADEAFLLGGNYLTAAVSEYSPDEAGRPGWVHNAGPHLNRNQTWWPMARPFFDYLARCCFLLQSGRNVAHVAVYYTFRTAPGALWAAPSDDDLAKRAKGFAFDYVNDDLVCNHMDVRDGQIVLPSGASYSILYVVPTPQPTIPLATLKRVRDLARQGATVVVAGELPEQCPSLTSYPECDATLRAIAADLRACESVVFLTNHDYEQLGPLLDKLPNPACWSIPADAPLRFVHRRALDADVFFVVNRADHEVDIPVAFHIQNRTPSLWLPDSGAIASADFEDLSDAVRVRVHLPAHGSVFVVFREGRLNTQDQERAHTGPATPIALDGPWELRFTNGGGAPEETAVETLKSWHCMDDPGIRYYSGIAEYQTRFECPERVAEGSLHAVLDLGRVAEVCEVWLNDVPLGVRWHPPYRVDVSPAIRPGTNRLVVRVANLWHNRIVGDADLPKSKRATRVVPEPHYERVRGKALIESGLLGPARIELSPLL